MLVSDIIVDARAGELSQISVSDEEILSYINLANIELHKRFNLRILVEALTIRESVNVYTLRSKNINKILSVYNKDGKEVRLRNVDSPFTDSCYDIEQISYNTFLVPNPPKEDIFTFMYRAAPEKVKSVEDEVDIPYAMLEAMLNYIGYRAHTSINGDIRAENNTHYMRFEKSCKQLEDMGYGFNIVPYATNVAEKGFV